MWSIESSVVQISLAFISISSLCLWMAIRFKCQRIYVNVSPFKFWITSKSILNFHSNGIPNFNIFHFKAVHLEFSFSFQSCQSLIYLELKWQHRSPNVSHAHSDRFIFRVIRINTWKTFPCSCFFCSLCQKCFLNSSTYLCCHTALHLNICTYSYPQSLSILPFNPVIVYLTYAWKD